MDMELDLCRIWITINDASSTVYCKRIVFITAPVSDKFVSLNQTKDPSLVHRVQLWVMLKLKIHLILPQNSVTGLDAKHPAE